jgi:hypothetical protein
MFSYYAQSSKAGICVVSPRAHKTQAMAQALLVFATNLVMAGAGSKQGARDLAGEPRIIK